MADEMVWVSPGIFETKVIVAPNSPIALAKPSTMPASTPGKARGSVTVKNTRTGAAPSVSAACSSFWSTASIDRRIGRTRSGNAITPQASAAPVQRNAKTIPRCSASQPPIRPRRPKVSRSRYPVTTGGSTSGKWISASRSDLPQKFRRASSQANAMPSGVAKSVATAATRSESRIAVHSVGIISITSRRWVDQVNKAVFFEYGFGRLRAQEGKVIGGLGFCGRGCRHRIDDGRMQIGREGADNFHAGLDLGVGRIDDAERGLASRHQGQRRAHAIGHREFRFRGLPGAELFQGGFGIFSDRD